MSVTTNTTNPVFAAEQESKMNTLKIMKMVALNYLNTDYVQRAAPPEYVGALCALSNKLLRGNSSKKPVKRQVVIIQMEIKYR